MVSLLDRRRNIPEVARAVKRLRAAGYTFREIMVVFDYKSANSITKLLKR